MKEKNSFKNKKQFILDMFPYPSGAGLHVGHVESYTATDILARYLRMNGKEVLHPQGFDAFGLPAENYAIKTGVHPAKITQDAIQTFKRQLKMMGFSYDWDREINSSDPGYYKWTQWFFLLFYKNGLVYKKKAKVNWCESCQTVLANEQAERGRCERCGEEVRQKDLKQWFFKITDFIEDKDKTSGLISGLQKVDWPQSTKQAQLNWIGKSEGAQFKMQIAGADEFFEVFTTRLDTVFGMTYAVLAPEHEVLEKIKNKIKNWDKVKDYINRAKNKTDLDRIEAKEKTGVKLEGVQAVNPFNQEKIPLFVADYVLSHYGAGAVMAVPAHDERDFEFAQKYNLEIREVVKNKNKKPSGEKKPFTECGILVNSGKYNRLTSEKAKEKLADWLEQEKIGGRKINYKIRDWLVSRQRYWGAPIPIIYCDKCGEVPVPEEELPVKLPEDINFKPTGESPLKYSKEFQNVTCPACGGQAKRESDTMDTFVCSSWYYLRYADPKNDKEFAAKDKLKKWLPVDLYVGGAEHVVLHLLYSRFFTKVLHYLGYLDFDEPFLKLRHQGTILAQDGTKMSKSKGNVINPDDVVREYGADALRLYEMFMGPLEDMKPWNTKGIVGMKRFLERLFEFIDKLPGFLGDNYEKWLEESDGLAPTSEEIKILLNKTIKKVSEDIESLKLNTAISQLMIMRNSFYKIDQGDDFDLSSGKMQTISGKFIRKSDLEKFITLLAPFAPHTAEELWKKLGHKESIFKEDWPKYDEKLIKDEKIEIPVMVNSKLRDTLKIGPGASEKDIRQLVKKSQKVQKWLAGKEPQKFIYIKDKIVNIVI